MNVQLKPNMGHTAILKLYLLLLMFFSVCSSLGGEDDKNTS